MAAPTAMNTQPWTFYVVRDKELMRSLAEVLPYAKMAADAAVLIVPCGDRGLPYPQAHSRCLPYP